MLKRNISLMLAISVVMGTTLMNTTTVNAKEISNKKQVVEKVDNVIAANQKNENINEYKPVGINAHVGDLIDSNKNKQSLSYLGAISANDFFKISFGVKYTSYNELDDNYRIEFYKNVDNSLVKSDSINFGKQKISTGVLNLSTQLKKSTYMKQKYIYIKFGVSKTSGGQFSDFKTFKVANPFYVENNLKPEIIAKDIELKVGDKFNPKDFVKATDKEDGDLTSKVQVVENNVDTSKEGTYKVSYKVTDSYGDSVSKTIKVTVKQGLVEINLTPEIIAKDLELKVGDKFDPMKGVTANDKEDGDLTSKIEVIKNAVDTSKEGTYEVTYKVVDKKGAIITKTIKVTLKQALVEINSAPEIIAKDLELKVGDKFDPMKGVTSNDKEDGDLTSKIEVIKNTVDTSKEGTYEVTYKVADKKGVSTTKTRKVKVIKKATTVNNTAPKITAKNLEIKVGDKFDPMKGIKATDKEDGDLTSKIKIVKNTVDTKKEGTYTVIYEIQDKNGLKTIKEIKVKVIKEKVDKVDLPKTGMAGIGLLPIGISSTIAGMFVIKRKNKKQ